MSRTMAPPAFVMATDATVSPDGRYRYALRRSWGYERWLNVCGLNPSKADAEIDDPTVHRWTLFAHEAGYDGLIVTNLFAYRATDPAEMRRAEDPVGPENDLYLAEWARSTETVAPAWGVHGAFRGRGAVVLDILAAAATEPLHCFGLTKDGHPRHILYLPGPLTLGLFTRPGGTP